MAFKPFTGKEKIGRINIEKVEDSIRLRWQLEGKRYSLAIGSECKETLEAARAKAGEINADIVFERFDQTLVKYGKKPKLEVVLEKNTTLDLKALWERFLEDKLVSNLKPKTKSEYKSLDRALAKIGDRLSFDALQVKKALLERISEDTTGRVLLALSTCCKWGMKHGLCSQNPFTGMISEVNCGKRKPKKGANAFTSSEIEQIYEAFRNHQGGHYLPLVKFWFKTGCRPSEAIGLQWKHISEDCSKIMFRGSIQEIEGRLIWVERSKNNKIRDLNVSQTLSDILLSIKSEDVQPSHPVFPAPRSKRFINYNNFLSDVWHPLVDPVKPKTTPYNCRDTFISEQLMKSIPSAVVSRWTDTSIKMIEEKYLDELRLSATRPVD